MNWKTRVTTHIALTGEIETGPMLFGEFAEAVRQFIVDLKSDEGQTSSSVNSDLGELTLGEVCPSSPKLGVGDRLPSGEWLRLRR